MSVAYIQGLPRPPIMQKDSANFTPAWMGWLSQAQTILQDASASGATTDRPQTQLYVGKPYFDTTLGIPIWMKIPGTFTWVNAAGAIV